MEYYINIRLDASGTPVAEAWESEAKAIDDIAEPIAEDLKRDQYLHTIHVKGLGVSVYSLGDEIAKRVKEINEENK